MKLSRGALGALVLTVALALAVGSGATLVACGSGDGGSGDGTSTSTDPHVAAALAEESDTSTYSVALQLAGLEEMLAGKGPFTVFAPSNGAVATKAVKLDESYLKVAVIEGIGLTKEEVAAGTKNACLLEDNDIVTYTGSDGALYVNSIKVLEGPITCANGVIYILNGVITPKG